MEQLKASILNAFPSANVYPKPSPDETGEYEVVVNGELVHSKLGTRTGQSDGYGNTPAATSRILDEIRRKCSPAGGNSKAYNATTTSAKEDKKALIISICSLLLSIPALIGA